MAESIYKCKRVLHYRVEQTVFVSAPEGDEDVAEERAMDYTHVIAHHTDDDEEHTYDEGCQDYAEVIEVVEREPGGRESLECVTNIGTDVYRQPYTEEDGFERADAARKLMELTGITNAEDMLGEVLAAIGWLDVIETDGDPEWLLKLPDDFIPNVEVGA